MRMTLQEAKSIARHLGLTLRKVRSGDYRVSCRDGNETTAYYTQNLEDAVNAGVEMAGRGGGWVERYEVGGGNRETTYSVLRGRRWSRGIGRPKVPGGVRPAGPTPPA